MFNNSDLSSLDLFAQSMVGNWRSFDSFAWHGARVLDDPDLWTIIYTSNRDSTLIVQSNAVAIDRAMQPYTTNGSAQSERHNHWACGYVDGYAVLVYDSDGQPTPAIAAVYKIACDLDQYPILDETDYSDREWTATIDNLTDGIGSYCRRHDLDLDLDLLVSEIVRYFDQTDSSAIESADDQGGYLSSVQIHKAMIALGYVVES